MLVLSRKQGQQLKVGEDVTITILEVTGHRIRVGIEAPSAKRILRGELTDWGQGERKKRRDRRTVAMAG